MATAVKQFHEEEAIGKTYDWQVARRLLRYLKPYFRALLPALGLTLLLNLLGIMQPMFTKWAIDWYILPAQADPSYLAGLKWLALGFLGVKLVQFVLSYVQEVLLNSVGQRVMYDLRSELYTKLQRQEVAYYDRNPVGRIMTRLTSDVDALNELFTSGIIDLLGDLVMIFAIVGMMLFMDWQLTLVTLITVPLLTLATSWFRKGARRGYDHVRIRIARINAFLQEHISGAQTVQIFNGEKKVLGQFHDINHDYRNANVETIFYYAVFFPLVDLIGAVGVAVIIWYGGWRVMGNTPQHTMLTIGALVAFIQ
ncbi:MAG: ATP-binding cassette, subfamily multidrug efflux pump, partial [Acidobacteriota bacterium]|nr:ATP-binding cassette, subfamily multidrug efflux pump [Acidobacteriota bacterium]